MFFVKVKFRCISNALNIFMEQGYFINKNYKQQFKKLQL